MIAAYLFATDNVSKKYLRFSMADFNVNKFSYPITIYLKQAPVFIEVSSPEILYLTWETVMTHTYCFSRAIVISAIWGSVNICQIFAFGS